MANNLVIQLMLKTGAFSNDLKTAKGQVQSFQNGCQKAGKSLTAFGSSLGINIGTLAKFGGAMGAAALAGDVLKKALIDSGKYSDEFDQAIQGAKSSYDFFINAIAGGGFEGFFSNMKKAITSGKELSAALDNLGSFNAISGAAISVSKTEYERLYAIAQNVSLSEVDRLEALQLATIEMEKQYNLMNKQDVLQRKASRNAFANQLSKKGIDLSAFSTEELKRFLEVDNTDSDYSYYFQRLADEQKAEIERIKQFNLSPETISKLIAAEVNKPEYKLANALKDIENTDEGQKVIADFWKTLNTTSGAEAEKFLEQQKAALEKLRKRILGGDDKKTTSTTPDTEDKTFANTLNHWTKALMDEKERELAILEEEYNAAIASANKQGQDTAELTEKYGKLKDQIEEKYAARARAREEQENKNKYATGSIKDFITQINEINKRLETEKLTDEEINNLLKERLALQTQLTALQEKSGLIKIDTKPIEESTDKWDAFNQTMTNTSTIVNSLVGTFEDGTKVTAASILNMVSTSLPAIGALIGSIAALAGVEGTEKAIKTSKHWIEAIAAVAAIGGVVAAAIASAKKNVGSFATGGIIGGGSFTGDRLTANVNSGEMILNKRQQLQLWKIANGQGAMNGNVEFHISGTDLVGVLNNNNRKQRIVR